MNPQLESRIKSFAWRTTWLVLAAAVAFVLEPDTMREIAAASPKWAWTIPILANIGGEFSKWLNNKAQEKRGEREPD